MSESYTLTASQTLNTYDEVPYESSPVPFSNPEHLRTIGLLFGMKPPKLDTARILELGCATGGNLIPVAARHPESKSVGVDLSRVQTDAANAQIKGLGLENIEIRCASITDLNESFGKFDYIIAHGVLSWVPDFVQAAIFDICGSLLTDNGIAYISYNTLPGWNMVRSIRDMMIYHSELFTGIEEKAQQSRQFLDAVIESLEDSNSPYAVMLKEEAELLSQQPDYFLHHEYLEENNTQFYFSEFMDKATNNSLQYVGDASLSCMFHDNIPAKVSEKLKGVNDIIRSEQYLDFINNRRFRRTILCKNTVKLNRSPRADSIKKFYLELKLVPEKPLSEVKISDSTEVSCFFFKGNKNNKLCSSSPIEKAIMYSFAENWNKPLSFDELVSLSNKKIPSVKVGEIEAELINNTMRIVFSGLITLSSEAPKFTNTLSANPKVSDLVRYQCQNMPGFWVTNEIHDRINIAPFEKYAFRYMDGHHKKEDLVLKLMEHVANGDLTFSNDSAKLEDNQAVEKKLIAAVAQMLEKTKNHSLLVG